MKRLLVSGFFGLGDTFYQRPVVRALVAAYPNQQVTLSTAYPQFYHDIDGLEFWYRPTILRSAAASMQTEPKYLWQQVHKRTPPEMSLSYNHKQFARGLNVVQGFEEAAGVKIEDADMRLAPKAEWLDGLFRITGGRPYVVVRCPTERAEWNCVSRNPQTGILPLLVEQCHKAGLMTISVGNNAKNEETVTEKLKCDKHLDAGQMSAYQVYGLFCGATAVLTGQGFAIPMSLSSDTPSFTVYGGYVGPELLYDERMGVQNLKIHQWAAPDPFCGCLKMDHNCNKDLDRDATISDFRDFLGTAMGRRSRDGVLPVRPVAASAGTSVAVQRGVLREVRGVRNDGSGSGTDTGPVGDSPEAVAWSGDGHRDRGGSVRDDGPAGDGLRRESDGDSADEVSGAVG
jgi:hypothetical protein